MTLEDLIEQRDRIIAQMAEKREERFQERTIVRRDVSELEIALTRLDGEIAKLSESQTSRVFTITTSRGL